MNMVTDLEARPEIEEETSELLAGTAYADLFEAPTVVDPRFVARLDDVAREQRLRNGRRAGIIVVVVAVIGIVALVAGSGLFAARQIDVRGQVHLDSDAVRRAAAVRGAPSMLRLDKGAVERRVERLPWVADAQVSIDWPNTLVVRVTEYEPVAYVPDHGHFALVAANGRVLDRVAARPTAYMKLVGIPSVPAPGGTLAPGRAVDVVDRLPESLARQVVGVDFARGGVALRLAGNVAVRLGDTSEMPAKTAATLAVLAANHDGCRYIDVSVPSAPVCGTT